MKQTACIIVRLTITIRKSFLKTIDEPYVYFAKQQLCQNASKPNYFDIFFIVSPIQSFVFTIKDRSAHKLDRIHILKSRSAKIFATEFVEAGNLCKRYKMVIKAGAIKDTPLSRNETATFHINYPSRVVKRDAGAISSAATSPGRRAVANSQIVHQESLTADLYGPGPVKHLANTPL